MPAVLKALLFTTSSAQRTQLHSKARRSVLGIWGLGFKVFGLGVLRA